jgi:hypothetical protein
MSGGAVRTAFQSSQTLTTVCATSAKKLGLIDKNMVTVRAKR